MGLEIRGNNAYFYGKKRLGNKVSSVYIGKGYLAEAFSEIDQTYQNEKALKREESRLAKEKELLEYKDFIDPIDNAIKQVKQLTKAVLLSHNYHTQKHVWRKHRQKVEFEMIALDVKIDNHKLLDELLKKVDTDKPNKEHIRAIRTILKKNPEIWREGQDVSAFAIEHAIDKFFDGSIGTSEILKAKINGLKMDLGWQDACLLERLLIDSVTLGYVRWILTELSYTTQLMASHNIEKGLYWSKRLAFAHRQYLQTIKALTDFRRFAQQTPQLRQDLASENLM